MRSGERLTAVDGVRGLAILVVLVHNSATIERDAAFFALKVVDAIVSAGWAGVQLFFVLSGFLITGILLDTRESPTYFRGFYIRRTLRIFPLYYAFLAVAFFVAPHFATPAWNEEARQNQVWFWTYVANWTDPFHRGLAGMGHLWSLCVEEQFYLVWPLLAFTLSRRRLAWLCAVLIVTTPAIRYALHAAGLPPAAAYSFTIARWDALAAGALLAILLRDADGRRWLEQHMSQVAGATCAAFAAMVVVEHGAHQNDIPVQVLGQSLFVLLSASLVWFSVAPVSPAAMALERALSARWLRFLGKYSYAIYIFHYPIHVMLQQKFTDVVNTGGAAERLLREGAYTACVATLAIGAALVSWKALEKPFLDLKDRFAPRVASA